MSVNRRPSCPEARYGLLRRIQSHRLFRQMLSQQGIDLASVQWRSADEMLFRAFHTCSHCQLKDLCQEWLTRGESRMGYLRFCPNSEVIECLRIAALDGQIADTPQQEHGPVRESE
jgi:hypothetical protein